MYVESCPAPRPAIINEDLHRSHDQDHLTFRQHDRQHKKCEPLIPSNDNTHGTLRSSQPAQHVSSDACSHSESTLCVLFPPAPYQASPVFPVASALLSLVVAAMRARCGLALITASERPAEPLLLPLGSLLTIGARSRALRRSPLVA